MQPSRVLITATLLLASVSNVMANESSTDFAVTGKITPSACTPSFLGSNIVDYGKISAQDLAARNETVLPKATLQLEVICNAPILMAVKSKDNRPGTAALHSSQRPESVFGLNLASGGQKIGRYTLDMDNPTADGNPGLVIEAVRKEGPWMAAGGNTVWQPDWLRTVSSGDLTPVAMTIFKVDVGVNTVLAAKNTLPIAEEIQIDGSATLEVIYL